MSDQPLLINVAEAAKSLAISERKLWELTNRNIVPHVRLGRSVRYSPEALREWVLSQGA